MSFVDHALSFFIRYLAPLLGSLLRAFNPRYRNQPDLDEDLVAIIVRSDETSTAHLENNGLQLLEEFYFRGTETTVNVLSAGAEESNLVWLNERLCFYDLPVAKVKQIPSLHRTTAALQTLLECFAIGRHLLSCPAARVELSGPYNQALALFCLRLFKDSRSFCLRLYGDLGTIHASQPLTPSPGMTSLRRKIGNWSERRNLREEIRRSQFVVGMSPYISHGALIQGAKVQNLFTSRIVVDRALIENSTASISGPAGLQENGLSGLHLKPDIIIWSRLSPEKLVAQALAYLVEYIGTRRDLLCVIAGDGPQRSELEESVSNLRDNFVFLGRLDRDRCLALVQTAKVALCPYSGATLLEAALLEKAILAFDLEWHHELVVHGYSGFLVPLVDYFSFAHSLDILLKSEEIRLAMGRHAHDLADSLFGSDRVNEIEERIDRFWRDGLVEILEKQ